MNSVANANSRVTESECEPRSGRMLQGEREPRDYRELESASERASERQRGDALDISPVQFVVGPAGLEPATKGL